MMLFLDCRRGDSNRQSHQHKFSRQYCLLKHPVAFGGGGSKAGRRPGEARLHFLGFSLLFSSGNRQRRRQTVASEKEETSKFMRCDSESVLLHTSMSQLLRAHAAHIYSTHLARLFIRRPGGKKSKERTADKVHKIHNGILLKHQR